MINTFTAACECPKCGTVAVHLMREPNPSPPERVCAPRNSTMFAWGGPDNTVLNITDDGFDRWDERPYKIVRTCQCGAEWGQR